MRLPGLIALALRLVAVGGRQAVAPLLTCVAVAIGSAFMLVAFAAGPAENARIERAGALDSGTIGFLGPAPVGPFTSQRPSADAFRDRPIALVDLAASGPGAPHPAGMELPRPGEVLVSRGLARLAAREPLLAQRYPATSGLLPDAVVPSPDTLMAVRGFAPSDVRQDGRWRPILAYGGDAAPRPVDPVGSLVIVLGSLAILAPVVLFTASATRFTAVGRERRLVALRLAGATVGQVARLIVLEAAAAAVTGGVAGIGLFFLGRPLAAAAIPTEAWYAADLTPAPVGYLVALVGLPLAAVLGALAALRRVELHPSGIGHRSRRTPRFWRVTVLLGAAAAAGASLLVPWTAFLPEGTALSGVSLQIVLAFDVVLAALLYAAPLVVRVAGAVLARAGSPAALLAGRRLTADPRAASRAVGGAMLGAFAVALLLTVAPALQFGSGPPQTSGLGADVALSATSDAAEVRAAERAIAGTPDVLVTAVRTSPNASGHAVWIGDCPALARIAGADPAACAPGRALVAPGTTGPDRVILNRRGDPVPSSATPVVALPVTDTRAAVDRPAAVIPDYAIATVDPDALWWQVAVLAPPDALEEARARIVRAGLGLSLDTAAQRSDRPTVGRFDTERLLRGALLAAYLVAGCSAAVAAAAGLLERRRSLALLRLAGTPLSVLRRSAALELVAPLLAGSLVAAAVGIAGGRLVGLAGGVDAPVPWSTLPGPLAAGLAIAVVLGSLALPLVARVTAGRVTRFE